MNELPLDEQNEYNEYRDLIREMDNDGFSDLDIRDAYDAELEGR